MVNTIYLQTRDSDDAQNSNGGHERHGGKSILGLEKCKQKITTCWM